MGIPLVASYTQNSGAATDTIALTKPGSVAVDDLLVLLLFNDNNTSTAQWDGTTYKPDADIWTFVNEAGNSTADTHVGAFIRVADGTEGATINVTAQSAKNYCGAYLRITGVDPDDVLDVTGADYTSSANLTTAPITGITTGQANTLALFLAALDTAGGTSLTVDSPWTIGDQDVQTAVRSIWGTQDMASAAATGTADCNTDSANGWSGFCFSINGSAAASSIIPPSLQNPNQGINPHKVARLGGHLEE